MACAPDTAASDFRLKYTRFTFLGVWAWKRKYKYIIHLLQVLKKHKHPWRASMPL
jgi:hypothetical protein